MRLDPSTIMKLAFCLYRYFPFGGLQRDFLRIARACLQRGHEVDVYVGTWEGPIEPGLRIEKLPVSGWQNHTRCRSFAQHLAKHLQKKSYDLVVGFNKMPGLDVYYAADVCYAARIKKLKPFWYQALPRYHQYLHDERQVFSSSASTKILVLAAMQRDEYRRCYSLPAERFHLLPPGISKDRQAPPEAALIRKDLRENAKVDPEDFIFLMVGSGFKTKGLDRVLLGLASLPEALKNKAQLWVVGQDNPSAFLKLAKNLGLEGKLHFWGGRHDVARFFLAADFLVHPAYHENTGTVLLEALVAGLPVLTVASCGYAPYVEEAEAGLVLTSPFEQKQFNAALQVAMTSPLREQWQKNALTLAKEADIYSLPERAVDLLESFTKARPSRTKETSFEEFMQLQGEIYREQKGRRTQRVLLDQETYFIKQHFGVGWKEIFKNLLQFKLPILSAKNEWQAIERLQSLAILTPSIKAYGLRGYNPARLQSFLLMEDLKATISLETYCRSWKQKAPAFNVKRALIQKVASVAKTLHENGINHRDFYICHFHLDPSSITEDKSQPALKLYLIDLHRAGLHKFLSRRWVIKDLAGLYFSSKDLGLTQRDFWRFVKSYSGKPLRELIMKEGQFWRKVTKRGEKLYDAHALPQL
jgi:UDP-glucose:(heptosyl)LPS alpha-1,3-glucosyltransferase